MAVLVYHLHAQALPGGFLGVDVFFVISGFIVTATMHSYQTQSLPKFVLGFYHRRLSRILPALLVVLLVTVLVWTLLVPRSWLSNQGDRVGLFAFAGLSNWALLDQSDAYFAPRAEFSPFTHTWSLGVEEQFYLIAPLLVFASFKRLRLALGLLAALAVLSLSLSTWWTFIQPTRAFYAIESRFWELAAGSLWYLVVWRGAVPKERAPGDQTAGMWALAGLMAIAGVLAFGVGKWAPVPLSVLAVIASVLLIGWPGAVATPVHALLSSPPARWIGQRSYSLYLWHWPVFVMFRWTVGLEPPLHALGAVLLSFLLAELSFRWIEQPILRSVKWHALPKAATTLSLVLLTAGAAYLSVLVMDGRSALSMSTVERHASDWYADHHDPTIDMRSCAQPGPLYRPLGAQMVIEHRACKPARPADSPPQVEKPRLFVLGDSHATAFLPMLHRLSVFEGVDVAVYQVPGCPYLDLQSPMGVGRPENCLAQSRESIADVLKTARAGDVVFLASLRLPRFGDHWATVPDEPVISRHLGPVQAAAREASVKDSDEWLRPFLERGMRVVISAPTPLLRAPPFRCVDPWTRHNPICSRGLSESRTDEVLFRTPVVDAIRAVVARHPEGSVSMFEPFDALCSTPERCAALDPQGRPLLFDADHITRWGNERTYPAFLKHWQCVTQGATRCAP